MADGCAAKAYRRSCDNLLLRATAYRLGLSGDTIVISGWSMIL